MSSCCVCQASTDGYLCKPCLGYLKRDLGDYTSLLHEASNLALGRTKVYRASRMNPLPDEELAELDEEYQHRMQAIPARLRSRDGRMALPSTAAVVNLDARDLIYDAYDTLRGQVEDLRDLADSEPDSWDDVVPWLLRNANHIRFSPDAESIYDELTYMHGRLERAVDNSPSRIFAGPCTADGCQFVDWEGQKRPRDLYAPFRPARGEDTESRNDRAFKCDGWHGDGVGCGAEYTWNERRPWLVTELQTSLVTIPDFVAAMPDLFPNVTVPPQASFRGWVRNQKLTAHGKDPGTGEPTYVGGDVLTLVQNYKPHAFGARPNRQKSA